MKNTLKAIPKYNAQEDILREKLRTGEAYSTTKNWAKWEADEKANIRMLQEAFYKDTKDINQLHNCYLASPTWIIKMATEEDK